MNTKKEQLTNAIYELLENHQSRLYIKTTNLAPTHDERLIIIKKHSYSLNRDNLLFNKNDASDIMKYVTTNDLTVVLFNTPLQTLLQMKLELQ